MGAAMCKKVTFLFSFLCLILFSPVKICSQNDVMMQAFYWDVPVDAANLNGSWWDTLRLKASSLSTAGFTGIWVPPPSKGNWGIWDMGYGIYDHYDLGDYTQKGTTETRFGSRAELNSMISTMHTNGVKVYADVVLNHIYGNDDQMEENPAVKQYVFDEAYRSGSQFQAYPTNEIIWKIPGAAAGDYYIQIKGYLLNWSASSTQRGYDVYIDWTGTSPFGSQYWESEPNNGGGQFNTFPASGRTVSGHIESSSDVDEYKITLSSTHDIIIKLVARYETGSGGTWQWAWAAQENGYYPKAVWYNGSNIASSSLKAYTATGLSYPTHTGTGEANFSWNYTHFHPVDNTDWLGFPGSDEIITNTKFFGNDLNTFGTTVQTRLKDWGYWMANTVGFDGFRLDFVRGFQESFAAAWVNNLPLLSGSQRFIVGEYWGSDARIKSWVNTVATYGADVDGFDFPLKSTLTDMCNGNGSSFNMAWLNHSGMVRNNSGNSLPGTSVVTFLDNHDTGKEHDKWVTKDYKMAYAYTLTHEGRPCIFYPHYYGVTQTDANDNTRTVTAPSGLRTDINKLIHVRKNYLGGTLSVLSETGNPYPSGDTYNVYAARRQGNGTKSGAIIVINNHDTDTKGLWVDSSPSGFTNWTNTVLANAFDTSQTTTVYSDGRVYVSAPPRGYTVWIKKSEYVAFAKTVAPEITEGLILPSEFTVNANYPNPFNPATNISFTIPGDGMVSVRIYNTLGQLVETLKDDYMEAGAHALTWNASEKSSGVYIYTVNWNGRQLSGRMMLLK
jgi:alpha-amylase